MKFHFYSLSERNYCVPYFLLCRLPQHILAQKNAVEAVVSAFSSWELDRMGGATKALVLAFSGPTGTNMYTY